MNLNESEIAMSQYMSVDEVTDHLIKQMDIQSLQPRKPFGEDIILPESKDTRK